MKRPTPPASSAPATVRGGFLWVILCLLAVLLALFSRSLESAQILFSSDGPLGAVAARFVRVPEAYTGMWRDIYWVGGHEGSALPSLTYAFMWLLKPVTFAKFYEPFSLLVLGLCAWLFFRQWGFRFGVCLIGALAAMLNTDFFSYACWGLGTITLSVAFTFLALAVLGPPSGTRMWLRTALAGLAVGLAVMEGFDVGAILSLYMAAFVLFHSVQGAYRSSGAWFKGAGRLALLAGMAAFIAAQALDVLVSTQIKGVVGMGQDDRSKTERWDQATMWSLPKAETFRVIIPGLFGYRMDTLEGGQYWGSVGQSPGVIQTRHSGSGVYGGVLVVVVALWGFLQSMRERNNPFSDAERRMVWFWSGVMLVSLLLAWGRHAPFYRVLYALPYFSTMRNPIKFMHVFHIGLVIVFGFGLQVLWRSYLERTVTMTGSVRERLRTWWASAPTFDTRWAMGLCGAVVASMLGWLLYAASRNDLEAHLKQAVPSNDPNLASAIAGFSLTEVGWFILFLVLTTAILTLVMAGVLAGVRARWAGFCLGLLLITDFTRANVPWVYYWNYEEKYATNPLFDVLRAHPEEHRVAMFPYRVNEALSVLQQVYHVEWLQHAFPYYGVQSLDVAQEPRPTTENKAYRATFGTTNEVDYTRMIQLTNTRFIIGLAGGFTKVLNDQFDPVLKRFRLHTAFGLEQAKAGSSILVKTNDAGPFALVEFTGALPRAGLYSHWQSATNDQETLKTLVDPAFDPAKTVLVSGPVPASAPATTTKQTAGTVEFAGYAPKRIQLKAVSGAPSVLLLNDKFDPGWTVSVDGRPQQLLRCNFLMRGVYLPAGQHQVEFRFEKPVTTLAVSVCAIGVGFALLGLLMVGRGSRSPSGSAPVANG